MTFPANIWLNDFTKHLADLRQVHDTQVYSMRFSLSSLEYQKNIYALVDIFWWTRGELNPCPKSNKGAVDERKGAFVVS